MELVIYFLLLLRSSTDSLFEYTRATVAGQDVTIGAALNFIVLVAVGILLIIRRGVFFPAIIWLPFLLVSLLSIAWSPDKASGFRLFISLATYAAIFVAPFLVTKRRRDNVWLLKAIIFSSFPVVLFGFIQIVAFPDDSGRARSTFSHPNILAFYMATIIGVILFMLSSSVVQLKRRLRGVALVYVAIMLVLLVLTQTRSAWAGCFIVLAVYAALVDRRYLAGLLAVPLLLFVPAVQERLSDLNTGTSYSGEMNSEDDVLNSYAWRKLMWESALKHSQNSRILGEGLASAKANSPIFFPLAASSDDSAGMHSVYVQTLYETGIVGLGCLFFLLASILWRTWKARSVDRRGSLVVASLVLAYLAGCYSDNVSNYLSFNWYFWGFLGIVFAKWDSVTAGQRDTSMKVAQPQNAEAIGPITLNDLVRRRGGRLQWRT